MDLLIFCIAYPILWLISVLPFRLLYMVSDGMFFLLYRLIGYRRKVVRGNLKLAFPDISEKELKRIERQFYSHLCDILLEMMKSLSISRKTMEKRFVFTNLNLIKKYEDSNRSVILICGHYASWEWMLSLGYYIKHKGFAIYTPLANKYFDRLVQKIRMRHQGFLISRYKTKETLLQHKKEGVLGMYGFASDQSPHPSKAHYWRPFMGVKVPVFTGAEMLAKRLDHVVLYLNIEKVKRGYYETTFKVLAENPGEIPDYEITDKFTELLEAQIRNKPEHYFWTHKRWKHRDKVPAEFK